MQGRNTKVQGNMDEFEKHQEKNSFTRLVEKLHAQTDRAFAMEKWVHAKNEVKPWQEMARSKLVELLGIDTILDHREPVTTDMEDALDTPDIGGCSVEYIYIHSWLGSWIPAYVVKPTGDGGKKRPAILCLHGHAENKDSITGVWDRHRNSITAGIDLARRGFITLSIDHWGFGERGFGSGARNYDRTEAKYNLNLLLYGMTINGLRAFDATKALDYLASRPDVDAKRMGCIGLSLGGTITMYLSAIDERVQVVVIEGYANTFKASIIDKDHCSCNYIPGMLKFMEMPDVLGLIAPRPMYWVTGAKDEIFPIHGFEQARHQVKCLYDMLDVPEHFQYHVHGGGHEYVGGPELDFIQGILDPGG